MMHMTFYWGRKVTLLVDSWKTDSWPSYLLTLLALFLFSAFYQYMENRRLRFKILSSSSSKPAPSSSPPSITTPLLYHTKNPARVASAILFGINSALGYLLMLAIMSFNGGVFIAVVVGLAVGYLIFRGSDEDLIVVENPCACA
ncbi:copper transporter 5 [Magnolia sinica]|uniref:copper transporter 5 n=1 Tax=Magnolia sinica TaxID=86752 RepID=UPI0026592BAD|nr:copper transporter 5 [Magnolia sinica]